MDERKKYKTFLGTYRKIGRDAFFLKFIMLGTITSVFLIRNMRLMIATLVATFLLSLILLGKDTQKVFKFLLLSTVILTVVWVVFVEKVWSGGFWETVQQTFGSFEYRNAVLRLYGMFLTGQLFLGITSQNELLASLRRINAPASVFILLVLMFNSVAYFIRSYTELKKGYAMRCGKKEIFTRAYYVFIALALEAMELISDCKKIYYLDAQRIRSSLKKMPISERKVAKELKSTLNVILKKIMYYGRNEPVIESVEGTFEIGQVYVIRGVNGAGKSTFLNAVSGVIPEIIRAEGEILVTLDGKSACAHIGYVPQGVEKSLFFDTPASMLDHLPEEIISSWIESFGLSSIDLETRNIGELSSGECKKFELIGEILNEDHEILLLDEPSAYLDEKGKMTLLRLIETVQKRKIILLVTHDEFFNKADAVFFCLEHDGLKLWQPKKRQIERTDKKKTFQIEEGDWHCQVEVPGELKERFGYLFQSLEFAYGKTLAILGENGTGKTVLDTYIFQHFQECFPDKLCLMMRQEMNRQFFTMSVGEEMLLGTRRKQKDEERARDLLKKAGLLELWEFPPYFLSGGQKRLLLILCMIMQNPKVIILDEPFDSMDWEHREILLQILEEYQEESGVCYLFSDQTDESFETFSDEKYFVEGKKRNGK